MLNLIVPANETPDAAATAWWRGPDPERDRQRRVKLIKEAEAFADRCVRAGLPGPLTLHVRHYGWSLHFQGREWEMNIYPRRYTGKRRYPDGYAPIWLSVVKWPSMRRLLELEGEDAIETAGTLLRL